MEYHISFEDHLAGMPAPAAPRYIRSIERRGRQNNFSDMSLLGGFSSRSQQTWNLSNVLHDQIFGPKILHSKNTHIAAIFANNKAA